MQRTWTRGFSYTTQWPWLGGNVPLASSWGKHSPSTFLRGTRTSKSSPLFLPLKHSLWTLQHHPFQAMPIPHLCLGVWKHTSMQGNGNGWLDDYLINKSCLCKQLEDPFPGLTVVSGCFPGVQQLRLCNANAKGVGSIPGLGTKIPCGQMNKMANNK